MVDRAPLTVVVPTRNRPEHLLRCLTALQHDLAGQDEIVVVDSASTPPVQAPPVQTPPVSAPAGGRLRVVRCDQPGASRARNAGWRAARSALVAFVDDDVRVRPGWADALVAAFGQPEVSFVAGAVDVPAEQVGAEQPVAVTTLTSATALTADSRGTLGATANLAVRADALERVGGFDERLGPGTWSRAAEDLDLLDRLFEDGTSGWFAPSAAAVHDQWRDRRATVRLQWGYGIGQGARLWLLTRRGQRARARTVFADAVWQGSLLTLGRDLRAGYRFGALVAGARLLGTAFGLARAAVSLR